MRTRTRSSGVLTPVETIEKTIFSGTCSNPTASTTSTLDYGRTEGSTLEETMEDEVTSQFDAKVRRGEIINNPMTQTKVYTENIGADYYLGLYARRWATSCDPDKWIYYGQRQSGENSLSHKTLDDMLPQPAISEWNVTDRAITEAWSRVDLSAAEMLVTLAEGKKTIVSLIHIFKRLFKVLRAAKQLRWWELKREIKSKELMNRWMELRYSLRPLVYEVNGIIDAIKNVPVAKRLTFRGAEKSEDSDSSTYVSTYSQSWQEFTLRSHRIISARAGVLTEVDNVSSLNLWGFDQLAEGIWELVPFSFVVDWFFNIGKFIASWTPEVGLKVLASWVVVTDITTQSIEATDCGLRGGETWMSDPDEDQVLEAVYRNQGAKKTVITTVKTRVPSPWRPIFPSVAVNLDAAKLLDLLIMCRNFWY